MPRCGGGVSFEFTVRVGVLEGNGPLQPRGMRVLAQGLENLNDRISRAQLKTVPGTKCSRVLDAP